MFFFNFKLKETPQGVCIKKVYPINNFWTVLCYRTLHDLFIYSNDLRIAFLHHRNDRNIMKISRPTRRTAVYVLVFNEPKFVLRINF